MQEINKTATFAPLLDQEAILMNVWRDGRVVDYNGLENRRAERHRGFESLSLRSKSKKEVIYVASFFLLGFSCVGADKVM